MKLSKKKSLPVKVYLRKDENMKEGDVLFELDRPLMVNNIYSSQMYWNKYSSNHELTFEKRMVYRDIAVFQLLEALSLQLKGYYNLEIPYLHFKNKKNPKKSPKIETKQPCLGGHIDCPPHLDYPDYCNQFLPF